MIKTITIKNIKSIFFNTILVIGLVSCSPILKTITGVRDIRMQTEDDLTKFCIKNGIEPNEAYLYLPEEKLTYPDSTQINFRFADQVLVFNKNGDRIIYKGEQTGNYCSLPEDDFFSGMNSVFLPLDTVNTLQHVFQDYRNIETMKKPMIDKEADYYLVYYWALWYKSFSKKNIKSVREILAHADTTKKIQTFYLNNDFVRRNYPEDVSFKKLKIDVSF